MTLSLTLELLKQLYTKTGLGTGRPSEEGSSGVHHWRKRKEGTERESLEAEV
jgi:hypothetical protein